MSTQMELLQDTGVSSDALDPEKMQAFSGKAFGDMASWCSVVMCSLGDRLGLFRDLATGGPATSAELAARMDLNERCRRSVGGCSVGEQHALRRR